MIKYRVTIEARDDTDTSTPLQVSQSDYHDEIKDATDEAADRLETSAETDKAKHGVGAAKQNAVAEAARDYNQGQGGGVA